MGKREQILEALWRSETPVSGERLAAALGVSRAAVWKEIAALREEGYEIESRTNRGYRLCAAPDVLSEAEILALSAPAAPRLYLLPEVDSTSTYAKRLALEGVREAVVIAERQTGGRGRLGRSFASPAGKGLYLSALIRPPLETADCALVTACAGVAVCDAVEELAGRRPSIKWTNDPQFDGKKLCGILTELSTEGESGRVLSLVVGVGINVSQTETDFGELAGSATSIVLSTGKQVRRAALAAAVIRALTRMERALHEEGTERYITQYRADCSTVGKAVTVITPRGRRAARALAVTDRAELLVEYEDGSREALSSGEVSVRPAQ